MFANRKTKLAVVCLLLTALSACSRKHEGADFLPSSPVFQEALQIVLAAISLPADGASTVRIEAQISPDAATTRRMIRFKTTLGSWIDPQTVNADGKPEDKGKQFDRRANDDGKAAAFLKSGLEVGVAVITVSVLDADNNNREITTVTGEVTFNQVTGALESFTVTPSSAFADGVSVITLEAKISADSPPEWNQVTFDTSLGIFDNETDSTKQTNKTVATDGERIARVQLRSPNLGTATVTATIEQFKAASATRTAGFNTRNPDAIQISTSDDELPADGTSQISVTATLATGLADKEVKFTTTAGKFVGAAAPSNTIMKTTDAFGQAVVKLQSDKTINPSVLLTATITLASNNSQSANTTVAFTEVPFQMSVLPDSLDFGEIAAGASADLPLTIGNHGSTSLLINKLTPVGDDGFSVPLEPALTASIPVGGTLGIIVRFNPAAGAEAGRKSAYLEIESSDTQRGEKGELRVALTGVVAAPGLSVDPASLAFGQVTEGTSSDKVLTITNTGTGELEVEELTIEKLSGTSDPPFKVIGLTAFKVAAGGSKGVTVRFSPTTTLTGPQEGALNIKTKAAGDLAVLLTGEGVEAVPDIAVDKALLAFGDVTNGMTGDKVLKITNEGTKELDVDTLDYSNALFATEGTPPDKIAPGVTFSLTVRFSPVAVGPQSGVLTIPSDDPDENPVKVDLTGNGI